MPDRGTQAVTIAVHEGRIAALLEPDANARAGTLVDATGLTVLPGMFDMHVHFREPGQTHKETFETGSAAAAIGGFTAVAEMPNTVPPTTTASRLVAKREIAARTSHVDFALWGGAGSAVHIKALAATGAVGIKVYLGLETASDAHSDAPGELVVDDDAQLLGILESAAEAGLVVAVHCGNRPLRSRVRRSWTGKGFAELVDDVVAEPQLHKVEAVSRTLLLSEAVGGRVHIVHVPAPALPLIRAAKDRGIAVTAEAALPFVTHDRIAEFGELGFDRYRSVADAALLWEAARDGTVDVLATDHAPHTLQEKRAGATNLLAAPSGYPELDTALPMLLDVVNRGVLTLGRLVELMSQSPRQVLSMRQSGTVRVGADADFVLVDMSHESAVDRSRLHSRAGWSPFEGQRLVGWPKATFLRGVAIARDGSLVRPTPTGRFLAGSAAGQT